jgi:hypothetical protein
VTVRSSIRPCTPPLGCRDRRRAEDAGRHQLVHQPQTERLGAALALAGEDQAERRARADEPGQPLAAAGARDEAQLHLGEPELGLGMIGGDTIVARERQLEAAAQAGAVDRGDDRLGQRLHPAHHLLPLEAQPLRRALGSEPRELLDVGTGDEVVGLARDEHRGPDGRVVPQPDEQRLELHLDRVAQLVDRLAGEIESDDRDAVFHRRRERRHYSRSRMSA